MITLAQLPEGHPGRRFLTGDTVWFAVQSDLRFSYGLHVPEGCKPGSGASVVVVVHSTTRRAQEITGDWSQFAAHNGALIVAPLFPVGISSENDLDGYKSIEDEGIRYDHILFDLLEEVHDRWGVDVGRFYLAGHSGGGQFAARMLLLHPGRLAGVVISAPGRITVIDPAVPWPAGTADTAERFGVSVNPDEISQVPILLAAGEQDVETADLAAQHDPSQDKYGTTRVERLHTLADNLTATGADVHLELVAGAGHSGNPTQSIAQQFLGALIARARS